MGAEDQGKGCRFLKHQFNFQNDTSYAEWLAQLTLTSKYNQNELESLQWAKQFSEKYNNFNEDEFLGKFKETRYKMKPMTCKQISSVWRHAEKPGIGCVDCPHKALNMPLNIRFYEDQDTGFRKVGKNGPGEINYRSFCDFLNKEELIQTEKDEAFYQYSDDYWQQIADSEFVSNNKHYIYPEIKPQEIPKLKTFMKNHNIFNILNERNKTRDFVFFNNCILNYRTGKIFTELKFKYKNFYKLDFNYDPKAVSPHYEKALNFAFKDNPKDKEYFLQFIAAALFTNHRFHKALVLVGDGSNGKSTLMNGINYLFPTRSKAFIPLNVDTMLKDEASIIALRLAKIAYCSDESTSIFLKNVNFLKRLIAGEEFSYRRKYSSSIVSFFNEAKVVIGMNTIPRMKEGTYGMKRRFSFLRFDNTLMEKDYDPFFEQKMRKEKAGIFNIYYDALNRYLKIKRFPEINNDYLDTAVELGDVKEAFWKNEIEVTENEMDIVSSVSLWESFQEYLKHEDEISKFVGRRRFIIQWFLQKKIYINKKLVVKRTGRGYNIHGIKLYSKKGAINNEYDPF